jgi:hypothetical protein
VSYSDGGNTTGSKDDLGHERRHTRRVWKRQLPTLLDEALDMEVADVAEEQRILYALGELELEDPCGDSEPVALRAWGWNSKKGC